jgi:uncharacterized protein HemY
MKELIRIMGIAVLATGAALPHLPASVQAEIVVRGEVVTDAPLVPPLLLDLKPVSGPGKQIAIIDVNGSFEITVREPGLYTLQIIGMGGQVLKDQIVEIQGSHQFLSLILPELPDANTSKQANVSVSQLSHTVPDEAREAFRKGQEAVRKHKNEKAVKHFREAVTKDPEFAEAYNELGASLFAMGQSKEAIEQFQKAIDLVPDHELALYNMCVVLGKLQRWHEAEEAARRSLNHYPDQPPIRFILAVSLISENEHLGEALDNLRKAAVEFPKAHLVAADVLEQTGRKKEAGDQLEEYLRVSSPQDTDVERVKFWLMKLRR